MNYTINTTADHREVNFDGDLIKRATSSVHVAEWDERTFTLELYAVDGGGFVTAIEMASLNAGIPDVVEAERVDTADDAESSFLLFEPSAHVNLRLAMRECRDAANRINRCVSNVYDSAVDEVLKSLRDYETIHPDCDVVVPPPKPSRIMKMLGLA